MDREVTLAAIAADQHGQFTHRQARACGFTVDEIRGRVERGVWTRPYLSTLRIAGAPVTWKGDLLAACWAGGTRAVASHRSAAALWGFAGGRTDLVELTCPRWRRARHHGLHAHESKKLDSRDVTIIDAIPVTSPELTLLHLGAGHGPMIVDMAYQKALKLGFVTWDSCDALIARYSRQGRNGVAVLRQVINLRDPSLLPTASEMETFLLHLLRSHGFPEPVTQHPIRLPDGTRAYLDLAFPDFRLDIEYQSFLHHSTELERARDNRRRNLLRMVDWEQIEARPDVRTDPKPFLGAIRKAMSRAV